jgi:hypothetical protein
MALESLITDFWMWIWREKAYPKTCCLFGKLIPSHPQDRNFYGNELSSSISGGYLPTRSEHLSLLQVFRLFACWLVGWLVTCLFARVKSKDRVTDLG